MRKRGLYWQARPKAGEKLGKWRSTRCTDLKAAQAVLADWERELADPTYRAAQGATLAQAVDGVNRAFQGLVRVGKRSQATADYYLEKSGVLLNVLGAGGTLAGITAGVVDRFVDVRRAEGVSEHTIAKELGVLRVVLKTAKRSGWWGGEIDAVLPHAFGTQAKPRERFVGSMLELGKILRAVHSPDIAAQIAFSVATGAEAQAIVRAQWTDLAERYVALHGKKRPTRERVVPIVASWQETLILFVRNHAMGDRTTPQLFVHVQGIRKALRLACQRLGIPHVSPNDLRRTFNVWMDAAGVPVGLRAQAMGHASTRLLDKFTYGKLPPDVLRARMMETFDGVRAVRGLQRRGSDGEPAQRGAHQAHGAGNPSGQEVQGGAGAREVANRGGSEIQLVVASLPVDEAGLNAVQCCVKTMPGSKPGGRHGALETRQVAGEGGSLPPRAFPLVQPVVQVCQSGVTDAGGESRTEPHISSPVNDDSPLKEAPRAGIEPATHGLTDLVSVEGKRESLSK